jgi:import inner membrane translocase subunit TIM22
MDKKNNTIEDVLDLHSSFSTRDLDREQVQRTNRIAKYQMLVSESCATKTVMAGVGGFGIGILWGSLSSPMELGGAYTPGGEYDPSKFTFRQVFKQTRERCVQYGKSFAMVGVLFSTFDCAIEKVRGKHDRVNSVSAGCLAGGGLAARAGYKAAAFGCAGFALFSFIIDSFMGTH